MSSVQLPPPSRGSENWELQGEAPQDMVSAGQAQPERATHQETGQQLLWRGQVS